MFVKDALSMNVSSFKYDAETTTAKRIATVASLSEDAKSKELYNGGSEIRIHPNGEFLYSGNRGTDTITVYRINPDTGFLTIVEVEPVRGAMPRHFNLESSGRWLIAAGRWLIAAGRYSDTLSVFEIDQATGELTFQRQLQRTKPHPLRREKLRFRETLFIEIN